MAKNRLHLNFNIESSEDRAQFVRNYVENPDFINNPLTEDELETIANYVLWGKDPITQKNGVQDGDFEIETRYSTWSRPEITSLDELRESETFQEATVHSLDEPNYYLRKKEKFSRTQALAQCPEQLRPAFKELWEQIDTLEYTINAWELNTGKRKKPIREALAQKFSQSKREELEQRAALWNGWTYLRQRHRLVELRKQQYILRDSFFTPILNTSSQLTTTQIAEKTELGNNIPVFPLGVNSNSPFSLLIFKDFGDFIPKKYSEQELEDISKFYWEQKKLWDSNKDMTARESKYAYKRYLDFTNPEHLYHIFGEFYGLEAASENSQFDSNLPYFLETLNYYIKQTELAPVYQEILDLKLKKIRNIEIVEIINPKWGKSYTPNYISTIFKQRIIPKICETAQLHWQIIGNLWFSEEFKTCTCCGKTYLKTLDFFMKKSRSKDGLAARCKMCEKQNRLSKKGSE